ncbi:MAG: hypothetical protein KC468_34720 [Myxococcales bacterium]|nr:hypothetical protein [Myxococcales bacterium]
MQTQTVTFLGDPMRARAFGLIVTLVVEVVSFRYHDKGLQLEVRSDAAEVIPKLENFWRAFTALVPPLADAERQPRQRPRATPDAWLHSLLSL